ncbi:MAG: hypothetical protein ACKVW3_09000 [Phycisphaerales bacterium]
MFDVNTLSTQALNSAGQPSPFGGLAHTGSIRISTGPSVLKMFIQAGAGLPFVNAGLSGFHLTEFIGQINVVSGVFTGGGITLRINNGDQYTCDIVPGSGRICQFGGGGWTVQFLTARGLLGDSLFGNVNVAPWHAYQGVNGLMGSSLIFNYSPNSAGVAISDMDLFANALPLPSAAWGGFVTLGALAFFRLRRAWSSSK